MREAKPIALVISNNGRPPNEKEWNFVTNNIKKELPDYRTLVIFQDKPEKDILTVQVFNGENITDTQFDELKKIILDETTITRRN